MTDEPTGPRDSSDPATPTRTVVGAPVSSDERSPVSARSDRDRASVSRWGAGTVGRFLREIVIIVVVALVASALLRAFVVQAFFVPSGSMLPEINLNDRILVSRIGDIHRGEVVVFEDPGDWIPPEEQPGAPSGFKKALEWVGVLPASGDEHLVKRVIGLPGDHVVCCEHGKLTINGVEVDESAFLFQGAKPADNESWDVTVPAGHIFVLGDHRYVSGDSSAHLHDKNAQDAFVSTDLVTGRAFAVIWPTSSAHILHIPDAYDDVPDGESPPDKGVITPASLGQR